MSEMSTQEKIRTCKNDFATVKTKSGEILYGYITKRGDLVSVGISKSHTRILEIEEIEDIYLNDFEV